MYLTFIDIIVYLVAIIGVFSLAYLLFAIYCVGKLYRAKNTLSTSKDYRPPVSIFKPICGLDPDMDQNLRSFCLQDYPVYQVIFGLHDSNDPAINIIKRIISDYPELDLSLVIDQRLHGTNHKVSNLINMFPKAKHDILLIADSDMRVPDHYLNTVIAPLANEKNGAVTCLYSATPKGGLASHFNAMFINEWFLPSVLISHALNKIRYCLGATMAVRREILTSIGGFEALKNYLADDYMLGRLITECGHKIHLSFFIVENIVQEADFKSLLTHELRWARTLRVVEPIGYSLTFLTDTLFIGCLTAMTFMLYTNQLLWLILIISFVLFCRILLHLQVRTVLDSNVSGSIWLVPIRDFISLIIRLASFTGNTIEWRNNIFSVDSAGLIHGKEPEYVHPNNEIADLLLPKTTE